MEEARRIRKRNKAALKASRKNKNLEVEDYFVSLQKEYDARIENGCYNPKNMELSGASMPINAVNENMEKVSFALEKIRNGEQHLHCLSPFININVQTKAKFETIKENISSLKDDDSSKDVRLHQYLSLLKKWNDLYQEANYYFSKYLELFEDE